MLNKLLKMLFWVNFINIYWGYKKFFYSPWKKNLPSDKMWHKMKKGIETAISTPYFQLKSSCNIGLQTAVTSVTYFRDTHNDYCEKPFPRHYCKIFLYCCQDWNWIEVFLCVLLFICKEIFFISKLDARTSINLLGLDTDHRKKRVLWSWLATL